MPDITPRQPLPDLELTPEKAEQANDSELILALRTVTIGIGLILPLVSGSSEAVFSGIFFMSWWPFLIYALCIGKIYRYLKGSRVPHPVAVIVAGLIGLAVPAVLEWTGAGFTRVPVRGSHDIPGFEGTAWVGPAMFLTVTGGLLLQARAAIAALVAARWIASIGRPMDEGRNRY